MKIVTFKCLTLLLTLYVCLSSCSSDGGDGGPSSNAVLPSVTTVSAENITPTGAVMTINITDDGGAPISKRGICWGTSQNPIKQVNNYYEENSDEIGFFEFNIQTTFDPNTTYYARAYAENSEGLQYGNSISFTTLSLITTLAVHDITTTKATLRGDVGEASIVGFVYSTDPNPSIADESTWISVNEATDYQINISGLEYATEYYVRAYVTNSSGTYTYGNQIQFKTAGYNGPGGGYVAFDKGESSDGWRYLEVHPTSLNFNSDGNGAYWGGYNTFISGLSDSLGSGPANTTIIANTVTDANCAAKLCQNLVLNGQSDWFLPSIAEGLLINNSLLDAGLVIGNDSWTSSQADAQRGKSTWYDFGNPPRFIVSLVIPKISNSLNVFPVRRY